MVFLCVTLIAGAASVFLTLKIGEWFSKSITRINYQILVIGIIIFVAVLVLFLTGPIGFFVLLIATAIGIIPAETKITRTHSMGCLLLPVILYFLI